MSSAIVPADTWITMTEMYSFGNPKTITLEDCQSTKRALFYNDARKYPAISVLDWSLS